MSILRSRQAQPEQRLKQMWICMGFVRSLGALSLIAAVSAPALGSEVRYVTDQYDFNLRSGESTRYKILRQLPSGTRLTILDTNEDTGYASVQTDDGLTGFILLQYLQDEPAAREKLETMQARLAELRQAPDKLAARIGELQDQLAQLESDHGIMTSQKQDLEAEVAEIRHASANSIRINRERQELRERVSELLLQVDQLEHRNLELSNRTKQQWFIIGAAVISAGVLIGLILPNLRLRKRRSAWGNSQL